MIHDWPGAVFVPSVTHDRVLSVVESYDRYDKFHKPLVQECTILARDGNRVKLNDAATQQAFSNSLAMLLHCRHSRGF
jgi:hypothetical protein